MVGEQCVLTKRVLSWWWVLEQLVFNVAYLTSHVTCYMSCILYYMFSRHVPSHVVTCFVMRSRMLMGTAGVRRCSCFLSVEFWRDCFQSRGSRALVPLFRAGNGKRSKWVAPSHRFAKCPRSLRTNVPKGRSPTARIMCAPRITRGMFRTLTRK